VQLSLQEVDPLLVVLAGGLATRLGPLATDRPKFLIEISGQPFGKYFVERYSSLGFKRFHFCLGHMATSIETFLGQYQLETPHLNISWSIDLPNQRSTLGALVNARDAGFLDTRFCLTYGDSYLLADCFEITKRLLHLRENIMTVNENHNQGDKSNCDVVDGKVRRYSKSSNQQFDWIDYGFLILNTPQLDPNAGSLESLLGGFASSGLLMAEIVSEGFLEVGSPDGIAQFATYLKTQSR